MSSKPSFDQILNGAHTLLIDILAQIVNLIVSLENEIKQVGEDQVKPLAKRPRGSPISARALKSSIVILQFSVLEALANFLAELIVQVHSEIEGAPSVKAPLSQVEIDFLREQRTFLDARTGDVRVQNAAYSSTLDKLSIVPSLFAKAYGHSFRLDKSGSGWDKIRDLKKLRDALTHIRLDLSPFSGKEEAGLDLDNIRPAVVINSKDLFSGSEAVKWYAQQIKEVCLQVAIPEFKGIMNLMMFSEFMCYMHLINLRESCGLTEKQFEKMHPMPHIRNR